MKQTPTSTACPLGARPRRRALAALLAAAIATTAAEATTPAEPVERPQAPAPAAAAPSADRLAADATEGDPIVPTLAAPQRWSIGASFTGGSYQWALTRGPVNLGLRFDQPSPSTVGQRLDPVGALDPTSPIVSVAWSLAAPPPVGRGALERATAAAGLAPSAPRGSVGVEWKPAQSRLFFRQGVGIRLSDDDRLVMRFRKGALGLFLRRDF